MYLGWSVTADLDKADHQDRSCDAAEFSASDNGRKKAAGVCPPLEVRYFCVTTATLCEPYCAVNEVLATFAPVA